MNRFEKSFRVFLFFFAFYFSVAVCRESAWAAEVERLNVCYSSIAATSITTGYGQALW